MKLRVIVLISGFAAAALANPGKKSPDLKSAQPNAMVPVIVQYAHDPQQADLDRLTSHGGTLKQKLGTIRGAAATIPAAALDDLSNDPSVVYISADRSVRGAMNVTLPAVGASVAFSYGWNGAGVTVAVVDSGIAARDELGDSRGRSRVV